MVGNLGSKERMDYTAIGDTVNISSRLENVATDGQILITSNTHQALNLNFKTKKLGRLKLKGKTTAVVVFEVFSIENR